MADTAIATVAQSRTLGTNVAAGQGTAIATGTTHVVTPTGPLEEMVILIWNTEGSTNTVTFLSGDYAGTGDLTITVAATTGAQVAPFLESARYLQHDGTLRIDVETGMTGFIKPIQLVRA